jgi:hypothetical protein
MAAIATGKLLIQGSLQSATVSTGADFWAAGVWDAGVWGDIWATATSTTTPNLGAITLTTEGGRPIVASLRVGTRTSVWQSGIWAAGTWGDNVWRPGNSYPLTLTTQGKIPIAAAMATTLGTLTGGTNYGEWLYGQGPYGQSNAIAFAELLIGATTSEELANITLSAASQASLSTTAAATLILGALTPQMIGNVPVVGQASKTLGPVTLVAENAELENFAILGLMLDEITVQGYSQSAGRLARTLDPIRTYPAIGLTNSTPLYILEFRDGRRR